LTSAYAVE